MKHCVLSNSEEREGRGGEKRKGWDRIFFGLKPPKLKVLATSLYLTKACIRSQAL